MRLQGPGVRARSRPQGCSAGRSDATTRGVSALQVRVGRTPVRAWQNVVLTGDPKDEHALRRAPRARSGDRA